MNFLKKLFELCILLRSNLLHDDDGGRTGRTLVELLTETQCLHSEILCDIHPTFNGIITPKTQKLIRKTSKL